MPEPDFVFVEELKMDLENYEGMWSLFEEFQTGLTALAKEDWISFRYVTRKIEVVLQ
jgi:dynein heavy chain 2